MRVPAGLRVQLRTDVGGGEVVTLDQDGGVAPPDLNGPDTGPVTVLDLTVGVGRIEAQRAAA